MLEAQQSRLVMSMQELYKRVKNGRGSTEFPPEDSPSGYPLIQDLLECLDVLERENDVEDESPAASLDSKQQQPVSTGVCFMQSTPLRDREPEINQYDTLEQLSHMTLEFPDLFAVCESTPMAPCQSLSSSSSSNSSRSRSQTLVQSIPEESTIKPMEDELRTLVQFPMSSAQNFGFIGNLQSTAATDTALAQTFSDQTPLVNTYPCLLNGQWTEDYDFQLLYNSTAV